MVCNVHSNQLPMLWGGHCNSKYDDSVGWHWQEKNNWKTLETKRANKNKKEKIKTREYKKATGNFPTLRANITNLAHFMEVALKSKQFLSVNVSKISKKHFYSAMQGQFSRGGLMKRCSKTYASNLQENTHAAVSFQ